MTALHNEQYTALIKALAKIRDKAHEGLESDDEQALYKALHSIEFMASDAIEKDSKVIYDEMSKQRA